MSFEKNMNAAERSLPKGGLSGRSLVALYDIPGHDFLLNDPTK